MEVDLKAALKNYNKYLIFELTFLPCRSADEKCSIGWPVSCECPDGSTHQVFTELREKRKVKILNKSPCGAGVKPSEVLVIMEKPSLLEAPLAEGILAMVLLAPAPVLMGDIRWRCSHRHHQDTEELKQLQQTSTLFYYIFYIVMIWMKNKPF